MARQFFVGGNFKLNPATIEAKNALVAVLNKAELDPATGAFCHLDLLVCWRTYHVLRCTRVFSPTPY